MEWISREEDRRRVMDVYRRAGFSAGRRWEPGDSDLTYMRKLAILASLDIQDGRSDEKRAPRLRREKDTEKELRISGYDTPMITILLGLSQPKYLLTVGHTLDIMEERRKALQEVSSPGCFNLALAKAEEDMRAIDAAVAAWKESPRR